MAIDKILLLAGVGVIGYFAFTKMGSKVDTQNIPNDSVNGTSTSTTQNTVNNTTEIPVFISTTQGTVLNPKVPLNENIINSLNTVFNTQLQGSQVSNIIHGGSIENTICVYRGTNGKCYSSYDEAKRNGAV